MATAIALSAFALIIFTAYFVILAIKLGKVEDFDERNKQ